jgi:hypothetical protein
VNETEESLVSNLKEGRKKRRNRTVSHAEGEVVSRLEVREGIQHRLLRRMYSVSTGNGEKEGRKERTSPFFS